MDQHLYQISTAALQRLEPALAGDERVTEPTFVPGDVSFARIAQHLGCRERRHDPRTYCELVMHQE
jgi:hypothetical protein